MRISDWSSDVCSSDLLAQVAVGSARDQAPRLRAGRHFPEHLLEIVGREGEAVAHGFQRAVLALRLAVTGHPQEDAGDQRLGFLVPMRLAGFAGRSEEHTSELQSLMRNSYAVFCLKKKTTQHYITQLTIRP